MNPGNILDSSKFELALFDKEKQIDTDGIICTEYKLYTDVNNLCLYASLTSPLKLIDLDIFKNAVYLQLTFLNSLEAPIGSYKFTIDGFSWEIEGKKGASQTPIFKLIVLLSSSITTNENSENGGK